MKKKLLVLPIILLSLSALIGCKKEDNNSQTPEPSSEPAPSSETSSETSSSSEESSSEPAEVFHVTFKNYDELELYVAEVTEGETAVYQGETPTKPSTVMNEYTFSGWDKDLTNVRESFTTYAQYDEQIRKYAITFLNWDDTVLQNTLVPYGVEPVYSGATPTKPSDARAVYTFAGWSPAIQAVTGEQTYKAIFDASYAPTYRTTGLVYQIQGYNEYYAVIGYFGSDTEVAIPQTFDGIPVKSIKANAFSGHDKLESVFIPKTVENIEKHAFDSCPALSHVTVGEGNPVYFIDDNGDLASNNTLVYTLPTHRGAFEVKDAYTTVLEGAFSSSGISNLKICASSFTTLPELFSVDPAHMPQALKSIIVKGGDISDEQFMGCIYLESISLLPSTSYLPVTRVGERAFKGCTALNSLTFPDTLTYIGDEAFFGCSAMTRLTIGSTENVQLSHVGENAFEGLDNVQLYTDYEYGSGLSYLGNPNCKGIIAMEPQNKTSLEYCWIPDTTVAFNNYLFSGCSKLTEFYLTGNKLLTFGKGTFRNCVKLQELHLGLFSGYMNNIDYLSYDMFDGCTKLMADNATHVKDTDSDMEIFLLKAGQSSQYIGPYVLGIAANAFANRNSEYSLTLTSDNPSFTDSSNILRDKFGNIYCAHFNSETTDAYINGEYVFTSAFYGQAIRSIVMEEGCRSIYTKAFAYATLEDNRIDMPNSLEEISYRSFDNLKNSSSKYKTINIYTGNKLARIGQDAFYGERDINLYTPFAERQEGWENYFDRTGVSYYYVYVHYSYGV